MQRVHKTICTKSRKMCAVPQCKSYCTPDIALHRFPIDPVLCEQWKIILKIDKPITTYMKVCSEHFAKNDFVSTSANVKHLKKGVLPFQSIPPEPNVNKKYINQDIRKWLKSNVNIVEDSEKENEELPVKKTIGSMEITCNAISSVLDVDIQHDNKVNTASVNNHTKNNNDIVITHFSFEEKSVQTESGSFNLTQILCNDETLINFTGINSTLLNIYTKCMENTCIQSNIVINQDLRLCITLVLCKMKTNMSFACLAVLFGMNVSTYTRNFYKYVNILALSIKTAIYWPTKEEIQKNLPKSFNNFKDTRIVLDSTEIKVQRLNCLKCRILTYSNYKSCHTVKFLIGITPSGLISYVSKAYGGRSSDKAIFCHENLINKLDAHDGIMVDKGFLIEKECKEHFVKLIQPPFLKNKKQLSKEDAVLTANIARARVHVERAIQRIKIFELFNQQIDWYLIPYIEDIITIAAATVNMSSPILADNKF